MRLALLLPYLAVLAGRLCLRRLNLAHLKAHGHEVPPGFEEAVDPALLARISDYTVEGSRLGLWQTLAGSAALLVFLFGGLLEAFDGWVGALPLGFVARGVVFVLLLQAAGTILDLPFSLMRTFGIERRHGFSTITPALWLADLAKSLALGVVLGGATAAGALLLVEASPRWWWLWVWFFFLGVGIFLMYLSPVLIEPLFFKFAPLAVEGLEERIRALLGRAGIGVRRVLQVDASRRSRHSNAYFTGIGHVKRIVLFDTLVRQMSPEEILAVLAHEAGHWKRRHVLRRLALGQAASFAGLFLASRLIRGDGLPALVGAAGLSFYARALVAGLALSLAAFALTPLASALARRDEREADRFASALTGDPSALASGLVKLARENLSNLHPHPRYAWFYYSHPPVVERVRGLRAQAVA